VSGYAVNRDPMFSSAIYVVERGHVIDYAGTSFCAAKAAVRGSRNITVWMRGKWMGYVTVDGEWKFEARANPRVK